MKTRFYIITVILVAVSALTSCNKFLDVMPDNRTEVDTDVKMQGLLVSAYPPTDYMLLTEFSSDNVDDFGPTNPNTDRFIDQVFAWKDITESDNEDTESLWGNSYMAIANANQVIQSIEDMGGAQENGLTAEMAEALLCRAYNHFILVNVFAQNYSTKYSATDLGITYMAAPELELNPKYKRQSVAEVYEAIDKDLQIALKWVDDKYLTVPKYHFNKKAAYAFAAMFYLFYEKWDESIKYADLCLGSEPSTVLRDWKAQAAMTQDYEVLTNHFIDSSLSCNLLLITAYSKMGLAFGPYSVYSKYSHGRYISEQESALALATLFGASNRDFYYSPVKVYGATNLDKQIFWKLPYLFEYTDPVAQIGYYRTVYPAFTTDYTLLQRAEAKIIRSAAGDLDGAAKDMSIWHNNISRMDFDLTPESIHAMMKDIPYSQWDSSTVKKPLNPDFAIEEAGSLQESMLQFNILLKRVEGLGQGLRWFDVKRYGIEVVRRIINSKGEPESYEDELVVRDKRRAIQIPKKVVDAGYDANPR